MSISPRIIGVVKWFDRKKGFGYIKTDAGDLFVHFSELVSAQEFKYLHVGEYVEYSKGQITRNEQTRDVAVRVTGVHGGKLMHEAKAEMNPTPRPHVIVDE